MRVKVSDLRVSDLRPGRRAWFAFAGVIIGLLAFGVYLKTLAPTVLYYDLPDLRDSAVFQVRSYMLGIADYTGYPTYTMLGKLFTYLPFGDVGYRVNLASAVYGALAVAFVYGVSARLTRRVLPSVAGAVAFAVSPLFWSQAVIAEVYTLNALFVAAVLFVLLVWRDGRRDRYLLLACFLMGFAMTNHLTSGLLLPAAFLFVGLVDRRKLLEWRLALKGAALFVVGLLPYIYLPLRSSMDFLPKGIVWGQPLVREYPPDTLYGFYNLVSGGLWKERMWAFGPAELPGRFSLYLNDLYGEAGQFSVWLVLVGIAGAFYLLYRDRAAAVPLVLLYFGWLFYALEYNIEDIETYFIPTFLILSVFIACGFSGLFDAARWTLERLTPPAGARAFVGGGVVILLAVVMLLSTLSGFSQDYAANDMSDDYHGREIINAVARNAAPNATILQHRGPLDYMMLVEHRREDLRLVSYLEAPTRYGVARGILDLRQGPVYILFPGRVSTPYYLGVRQSTLLYRNFDYNLVPVDKDVLLYQVVKEDPATTGSRTDEPEGGPNRADEPLKTT